jgi:hypothetical protein
MATLDSNVFGNHTPVVLGRLRNGVAADVARTARESSVASKYHYSGIRYTATLRGDPATFVAPCPDTVLFEAQFRSALSTLVEASVAEARVAHTAANSGGGAGGGAVFDETAARVTAAASPISRLEAIALGAVRASLVASYEVADANLRNTESEPCVFTLVAPGRAADEVAYLAQVRTPMAGWGIQLRSLNTAARATPAERVALEATPLTVVEADLAFGLMALGQVAPVRAGAQLFEDGHHYHSDVNASARHRANESEVVNRLGPDARNIWRANLMTLRNVIWHASIHPVESDFLQGLAEDPDMPGRLDATGFGSFSVGLPAQEDLFRRAGSYMAVLTQVRQTAAAHGHTLDLSNLAGTVTALATVGRDRAVPFPATRPSLPNNPAAAWPPGCNTRAKVLKLFLEPALVEAEPVAAWMFGYYREICSRAGIRANSQEGSLMRSYSLRRAMGNFIGEANRAQEMYSARARYIRAQGEDGNLETYTGRA